MNSKKNIVLNSGVKFYADSDLEQWRAKTLLDKEPETIAWIRYFALLGGVFYDVGANIGPFSLFAAALNNNLSVYSFEPVKENYMALLNNLDLNKFENVYPYQFAISNKNQITNLFLRDGRVGSSGSQIDAPKDESGNLFKEVGIEKPVSFSLNYLIECLSFPIPGFVKIDVDGHEVKILEGMTDILSASELKSILVEFNSMEDMKEYTSFLGNFSLIPDDRFNKMEQHSSQRRLSKNASAVNCVFSKRDQYV